jgi:hypothetical protein
VLLLKLNAFKNYNLERFILLIKLTIERSLIKAKIKFNPKCEKLVGFFLWDGKINLKLVHQTLNF